MPNNDGRYTAPDGTVVRPEPYVFVLDESNGTFKAQLAEAKELDNGEEHHFDVNVVLENGNQLHLVFSPEYAERLADELIAAGYGPGGARR
jgi:hypothetical protein